MTPRRFEPNVVVMETLAPGGSYLTPSFEHATARDAMRPWVLSCTPETPLVTAAQRMSAEHVHALVVLAPGIASARVPWAVLTAQELLRNANRADQLTAGDVASPQVLEVLPDDPLAEVAKRMAAAGVSHALVADPATGRPVGVVSSLDIAGILAWGRA
jgi:CBS domain-containing protein